MTKSPNAKNYKKMTKNDTIMIENEMGDWNILKKYKKSQHGCKWSKMAKSHIEKKWQKPTKNVTKGNTETF